MSEGVSVLDNGVVFEGNLVSSGTFDVSCRVKGIIVADVLLIKEGGYIEGDVFADSVVLSKGGKILGNLNAKTLKILKGAEVEGKVAYSFLSMEDGAKLVGSCEIKNEDDLQNLIEEQREKLNSFKKDN